MSIIETKHTHSRLNILKRDLMRALTIFSCLSMLAFTAYYIYLIIQNLHNVLYLVIYSVLIVSIISLFCIETFIKEDKKLLKNDKRKAIEKKRKYKQVVKHLKFVAKLILVGVAIYETVTNFDVSLSNVINICSAVLLVIQFLFDRIANYIIEQIDYFRLSLELDLEDSWLLQTFLKEKHIEEKAIIAQGGSVHTPLEQKMIAEIKEDAKEFEKEEKTRHAKIKKLIPQKLEKLMFWKKLKRKSK